MYEQLGVNAIVVQRSTLKVYVQPSIHCLYLIHAPEIYLKIAHGSTPVSTIFWKFVKFVIIDRIIFNKEITSRVARLHPRRMKQVNIMAELLRKPGNRYLRELKSKTFPRGWGGGVAPGPLLEAHLGNQSVFILDLPLRREYWSDWSFFSGLAFVLELSRQMIIIMQVSLSLSLVKWKRSCLHPCCFIRLSYWD